MKFSKKTGYFLILAAGLLLVLLVLLSITADDGYNGDSQRSYPDYVPDDVDRTGVLDEIYLMPLQGDDDAQKIKNFAFEQIRLNEVGSFVFGSALYSVSQFDPGFNQGNRCGIAGWECSSGRWRLLFDFSRTYSLDYRDLKTQLLFINFELNGLSPADSNQGDYRETYDDLRTNDDFIASSREFMQAYLDATPVDLTGLAEKLYGYTSESEPEEDPPPSPSDDFELPPSLPPTPIPPELPPSLPPTPIPPELPPTPVPLEPEVIKPVPTPQPAPPSPPKIDAADCWSGLDGGYIATSDAADEKGKFLESMPAFGRYEKGGYITTLAHRCLKDSLVSMLETYNASVSLVENKVGGTVWRSQSAQIESRKRNCGTSYYDIWEKPAEECDDPVARPGYSAHQDGLAIDFHCYGQVLSRTNCGGFFDWLDCNAAAYGLINLPSESWHWYYPIKDLFKLTDKLQADC